MALEEFSLRANGLDFHALAAGPADGPLVLLLHGFPELALSWRHQLAALGAAGYRAVAPDLRGYGKTGKDGPYDERTLAGDAAGLCRALGRERMTLVGHDWGGAIAWATCAFAPEVVERLVVLNCPHPAALADELVLNPRQLLRSWYLFFFQLPWLPERLLTRNGAGAIARALRGGSALRDAWTPEALRPYRENFLQPGAAHAALGYYRAAFRVPVELRHAARIHPIAVPTLILWGTLDRFLGIELIEERKLAPWFADDNHPVVHKFEGVGHFVQSEAPERVSQELLAWLGPPGDPRLVVA